MVYKKEGASAIAPDAGPCPSQEGGTSGWGGEPRLHHEEEEEEEEEGGGRRRRKRGEHPGGPRCPVPPCSSGPSGGPGRMPRALPRRRRPREDVATLSVMPPWTFAGSGRRQ
ncbi:unnamed protein product [Prorocentrum cordatum]|uniref:Uncharacterized protein n=1 Tax=Prorocentrum cordatum TaxID=2364126 RepID=A0ABN9RJ67_9DINO|nr:unnamed protein product [Polarella glacialis]